MCWKINTKLPIIYIIIYIYIYIYTYIYIYRYIHIGYKEKQIISSSSLNKIKKIFPRLTLQMTFLNFFILAIWCHYSYISLKWKAMHVGRVWIFSMLITPKNALIKMSLTLRKELLLESFQCCFQPQKPETVKTRKMENLKQNSFSILWEILMPC